MLRGADADPCHRKCSSTNAEKSLVFKKDGRQFQDRSVIIQETSTRNCFVTIHVTIGRSERDVNRGRQEQQLAKRIEEYMMMRFFFR